MRLVRETWGRENLPRNGSITKRLVKKFGVQEAEYMIRGAALLGWKDLRGLYSKEGIGRRWALTAWWHRQKRAPADLERLGAAFKRLGLT
jgi:hypothetical protein